LLEGHVYFFALKILNANQNVTTDITVNMAEKIKNISLAIDDAIFFFLPFIISNN